MTAPTLTVVIVDDSVTVLERIGALPQSDRAQLAQQGVGLGPATTQIMARRNGAALEIARFDGGPTFLRLTFSALACAEPSAIGQWPRRAQATGSKRSTCRAAGNAWAASAATRSAASRSAVTAPA